MAAVEVSVVVDQKLRTLGLELEGKLQQTFNFKEVQITIAKVCCIDCTVFPVS